MNNKYEVLYKDTTQAYVYDFCDSLTDSHAIIRSTDEDDIDTIKTIIADKIFNFYKTKIFSLSYIKDQAMVELIDSEIKKRLMYNHITLSGIDGNDESFLEVSFPTYEMHKYVINQIFFKPENITCINENNTLTFKYSRANEKEWLMDAIKTAFALMNDEIKFSFLHFPVSGLEEKYDVIEDLKEINLRYSMKYIEKHMLKTDDDLITVKYLTTAQANFIEDFIFKYE